MQYSIGEVAKLTGITISTLRYYDKEGLFPEIARSSGGIRVFTDTEIEVISMIECLKASDMSIKEIKQFFDWCQEGDASLEKRLEMFHNRLDAVTAQMDELQKTLDTVKYKCWYYGVAVDAGSEEAVKKIPIDEIPKEIQKCMKNSMTCGDK